MSQKTNIKKHNPIKILATFFLVASIMVAIYLLWIQYSQNKKIELVQLEHDKQLGISRDPVTDRDKDEYKVEPDAPRIITIPKINVSARVQAVGLINTNDGANQQMDAPKNIHDAGWYNCQINPQIAKRCTQYVTPAGEDTSQASVIDGHSCSGANCIFDKLNQLQIGDRIEIELGNGDVVDFSVKHVETVNLNDVDMEAVMRPYEKDTVGLNLITCDGSWTSVDARGARSMNKRTIVYSSRDDL